MMEIYPAIDLMNGEVVRLAQGNPDDKTRYNALGSPIEVASRWETQGAERLHIVDLDAALGRGSNLATIREIANVVSIPIQVGGGFRNEARIALGFSWGIERIILGSLSIQDPEQILKFGNEYGFDRIVVSLDYKNEKVATQGWQSFDDMKITKLLDYFRKNGVRHFLMTSIDRDGRLQGPDMKLGSISDTLSDIIIAGGLTKVSEVEYLAQQGFGAAILGKALYENLISLPKAIQSGRCIS
jgi:phosphoribosylformimino-5-aminoimidazole carboxamide ribotide isomerase